MSYNDKTKELSDKIKTGVSIDKTGVATVKEGLYESLLPEGLTISQVKAVADHNSAVVAAGSLAIGELSNDVLKKNKSVERITASIPTVGKDSIDFDVVRSREVNAAPGSDEKITKYLSTSAKINNYATGNHGELKKVKAHLAELGMKTLGK